MRGGLSPRLGWSIGRSPRGGFERSQLSHGFVRAYAHGAGLAYGHEKVQLGLQGEVQTGFTKNTHHVFCVLLASMT